MVVLTLNKFYRRAGGAEVNMLAIELGLKAARHKVVPFAMTDPRNIPTEWARFFAPSVDFSGHGGLKNSLGILKMFWSRPAARALGDLLNELIRKKRWPNVAHAHNIYHQLTPSVLAILKRHHIPVVMSVHDMHFFGTDYGESRLEDSLCGLELAWHRAAGHFEKYVDLMIAPSRFIYKELVRWGYPPERIIYLQHAVEALPKVKAVKQAKFLKLVFVGRLAHEKGVHHLLSALGALPPQVRATIVGDGPLKNELMGQVKALKLGRRVDFVGFKQGEALSAEILKSHALVVPSSVPEAFGLTMVEAFSLGRPVLAFDHGAAPEIITPNQTGWLVPPTTEGLIDGVYQIMAAAKELPTMNKAAALAAKKYDYESYLPKLLAVYKKAQGQA